MFAIAFQRSESDAGLFIVIFQAKIVKASYRQIIHVRNSSGIKVRIVVVGIAIASVGAVFAVIGIVACTHVIRRVISVKVNLLFVLIIKPRPVVNAIIVKRSRSTVKLTKTKNAIGTWLWQLKSERLTRMSWVHVSETSIKFLSWRKVVGYVI